MRPITFTKLMVFKSKVLSLADIYIENDINYDLRESELKAKGSIIISGIAKFELEETKFEERLEVDCELTLSKIDCGKDLGLKFKDYTVVIDERLVRFNLRYDLVGNGEKLLSFKEIGDEVLEEQVLKALNRDYNDSEASETTANAKKIKELFKSGELDIVGAEDLLPILSSDVEDIKEEELAVEPVKIIEEAPIEIEVPLVDEPIEKKEVELVSPSLANKTKESGLFKEEKYEIAFFFVKATKDCCSYKDISAKFLIPEEALRSANNNKDLFEGKLVKIPK